MISVLEECRCGSDEHWIPSVLRDRIYTCMLCHKPVGVEQVVINLNKLIDKISEGYNEAKSCMED